MVYIGIEENGGYNVYKAREYQEDAYHKFMNRKNSEEFMDFNYNKFYIFKIEKFDTRHLGSKYDNFCVLVNKTHDQHILSNDYDLLKNFLGWRNRIMM